MIPFDRMSICEIHKITNLFYFSWRWVDNFTFISTIWVYVSLFANQVFPFLSILGLWYQRKILFKCQYLCIGNHLKHITRSYSNRWTLGVKLFGVRVNSFFHTISNQLLTLGNGENIELSQWFLIFSIKNYSLYEGC